MPKVELSIIIACYNEGSTFENSVKKVIDVVKVLNTRWEIIFVEDKSADDSKKTVDP